MSKYSNVFSKSGNFANYLPKLHLINDLKYDISDYDKREDWMSLGASPSSALTLSLMAVLKDKHDNNWERFKSMIEDLPTWKGDLLKFNGKYGMRLKTSVNPSAHENMVKVVQSVGKIFTEEGTKYNFDYLFKQHKHLNINLQLNKGNISLQRKKARLIVGKALEKLVPILIKYKPVIVFEECDLLIPRLAEGDYFSSSDWIQQYVLKIAKRVGCMLIFIVQDEERCEEVISYNHDWKIQHEFTPLFKDRGVFSWQSKDYHEGSSTGKLYFIPYDASSQYENYGKI